MTSKFISSVWEFDNDARHSIHDAVRWYGRLPQQLVRKLIPMYSKPRDLVMANFAGSGTVLIESNLVKRHAYGTDTHPLSILTNVVKINRYVPNDVDNFLHMLQNQSPSPPADYFTNQYKWFDANDLSQLTVIINSINKLRNRKKQNFYKLALSNIIRDVSKTDSRCVNHIVVDKNKPSIDVLTEFKKSVYGLCVRINDFKNISTDATMTVKMSDARSLGMPDSCIDLMITHPPYSNAVLYYNIYSLITNLLGYDYEAVRKSDLSSGCFDLFLTNIDLVLKESFRVLRPGGYQVFIIGDTRRNGDLITALPHVINTSRNIGFRLEDIFIWKLKHKAGMNVARRGNHIDHNYLLVMQKK